MDIPTRAEIDEINRRLVIVENLCSKPGAPKPKPKQEGGEARIKGKLGK